ncbi:MAG: hypothetical protein IPJ49_21835 [Candidatus Obscuribacter sp.]|nr:hypothetical protein [Candidatus Obscuribacter sp.]
MPKLIVALRPDGQFKASKDRKEQKCRKFEGPEKSQGSSLLRKQPPVQSFGNTIDEKVQKRRKSLSFFGARISSCPLKAIEFQLEK